MAQQSVVLCHFCESHGPRVIFTTTVGPRDSADQHGDASDKADCRGSTDDGSDDSHAGASSNGSAPCPMCSSLPDGADLHSNHGEYRFTSRRAPLSAEAYSRAAATAVRTLSGEVREGVLVYGTEEERSRTEGNGNTTDSGRGASQLPPVRLFVLAHLFRLQDVQARGFSRGYAIALLVPDQGAHLLSCFEWLSRQVKAVAGDLRQASQAVYDEESQSLRSSSHQLERQSRFHAAKLRTLADLLRRPHLFSSLHDKFCWLLRSFLHAFAVAGRALTPRLRLPLPAQPPPLSHSLAWLSRVMRPHPDKSAGAGSVGSGVWANTLDKLFAGDQVVVVCGHEAAGATANPSCTPCAKLIRTLDELCPIPQPDECVVSSPDYLHPFQARILGLTASANREHADQSSHVFQFPAATASSAASPSSATLPTVAEHPGDQTAGTHLGRQLLWLVDRPDAAACWTRVVQSFLHKCLLFGKLRVQSHDDPALISFLDIVQLGHGAQDLTALRFWAARLKRQQKRV